MKNETRNAAAKRQRKPRRHALVGPLEKRPTGIRVFDEISGGGLPKGRASVIFGSAGTGKTIFALQTLRNAAVARGEVGIFVSFEERGEDIVRNSAGFGWQLEPLIDRHIFLVNGRLPVDAMQSGDADIAGLLAALQALATRVGASWVVFDSLDAMLSLMEGDQGRRREIMRLHGWIEAAGLTCLITSKRGAEWGTEVTEQSRLSYLVDCVIDLEASLTDTLAQRTLRILKYRGSAHYGNQVPCLIGSNGFQLVPVVPTTAEYKVFADRISTGIPALDDMFGGGILRGSAVLLTGAPGTAKTSITGRFVEAHCARGETALVACFDESPAEIVRNLTSIGIDLAPHVASGRLHMRGMSARWQCADLVSSELHDLVERLSPTCLVVDPISALLKGGGEMVAMGAFLQIFQLCKVRGLTLMLPCIVAKADVDTESSEIHASTVADVWIHLSYLVRAGERNRLLTVVKARGTAHSNQVRELILSNQGIALAAPYTEEGEVLTGTLRWQKEQQAKAARLEADQAAELQAATFARDTDELAARIAGLQRELAARAATAQAMQARRLESSAVVEDRASTLLHRRGGAAGAASAPATGARPPKRGG